MIGLMHKLTPEQKADYETRFSQKIIVVDQEVVDDFPEVDCLISTPNISVDFLKHFPNLKLIFTLSSGVNKMPFDYLKEHNIILTNSRGMHAEFMSEHALAVILSYTRDLRHAYRSQLAHHWSQGEVSLGTVYGSRLCIVGAGTIGQALASKSLALGMSVTGVSRTGQPQKNFEHMYVTSDLHQAISQADIVVLLTPLTPETFHLFDRQTFAAMKKGSCFINISRGETVDESALLENLTNGKLSFAGLDVFEKEPLSADSPFWDLPNVLITPHSAGDIDDYLSRAMTIFAGVLSDFLQDKAIRNRVDLELGY
ncbi:MAG: D-2-hydroxyacid dehydrogenase [Lactococcus plantarum]|nr:D-2-hydroxyacid dehydrogenase [Lactococcus plantarum]MDN6070196.1 D-2-hydroxyacid dehydrogenase [Lactococcus plantarum]MDN6085096.1 D-2-hydroxyacid dehydrogenase [Lactococcus plantarum]